MRTESYEILMPEKARVMTEEEMEYEGGFLNFIVAAVCSVASVGCSIMAAVDKKNSAAWTAASYGLTAVSTVCSFGVGAAVSAVAKGTTSAVAKKVASSRIAGSAGKSVVSGTMSAGEYAGYRTAYLGGVTVTCAGTKAVSTAYRYRYR